MSDNSLLNQSVHNSEIQELDEFHAQQKALNHISWGELSYNDSDFRGAVQRYTSAISLVPNEGIVYYKRAKCYHKLNDHKSALADLDKAIEILESYPEANKLRGI